MIMHFLCYIFPAHTHRTSYIIPRVLYYNYYCVAQQYFHGYPAPAPAQWHILQSPDTIPGEIDRHDKQKQYTFKVHAECKEQGGRDCNDQG